LSDNHVDIEGLFRRLAETGHAPQDGCALFGTGYEAELERLRTAYFESAFKAGRSSTKYVIGPYGSGKTHFVLHLMELARQDDCITTDVNLEKLADTLKPETVLAKVASALRPPESSKTGVGAVIEAALSRQQRLLESKGLPSSAVSDLLERWIDTLGDQAFVSVAAAQVLRVACQAQISGNREQFEMAERWLSGEAGDRHVARAMGRSPLSGAQLTSYGKQVMLSLCQFNRFAGFRGTVLTFDEAEQNFLTDRKRGAKIFSSLLSDYNAIVDLRHGSALFLYAVTAEVMDALTKSMPMLQQRLADPGPQQGFFDGNVHAAKIDLTQWGDRVDVPYAIGEQLVQLFFARMPGVDDSRRSFAHEQMREVVRLECEREGSSSVRRPVVKAVAHMLLTKYGSEAH
jgi:hypothetical protein